MKDVCKNPAQGYLYLLPKTQYLAPRTKDEMADSRNSSGSLLGGGDETNISSLNYDAFPYISWPIKAPTVQYWIFIYYILHIYSLNNKSLPIKYYIFTN